MLRRGHAQALLRLIFELLLLLQEVSFGLSATWSVLGQNLPRSVATELETARLQLSGRQHSAILMILTLLLHHYRMLVLKLHAHSDTVFATIVFRQRS
jgi:hypothetical protein